jgi:2-methylaconitate cis-trans-isomerase PrpF
VGIEEATVDWGSNCGNCSAVVGLYAIQKGWVNATEDTTRIVTRNTNTGQVIVQRVATPAGALPIIPDAQMPGVPVPGYRVGLGFQDPAGKTTGALLPSGAATESITAGGTRWTVSMLDAGAPVVIVRAEELGLDSARYDSWHTGVELQLDTLDQIRRQAAVRMGLAPTIAAAARAIPKLAIVAAPTQADPGCDVNVMMLSMGRPHPALAITGSIALTLAAYPRHRAARHHRRHAGDHPAPAHPRRGDRNLERAARREPDCRCRPHGPHHRHRHHPPPRGLRQRRRSLPRRGHSLRRPP